MHHRQYDLIWLHLISSLETDERENKHHRTKDTSVEIVKRLGLVHMSMASVGFKVFFLYLFSFFFFVKYQYKGQWTESLTGPG